MEAMKWSDTYSVGHAELDQQHQKLFNVFGNLVHSIQSGGPSFHMEQAFTQVCGYVRNHFRFEERLMKKADFPNLEKHKKQHAKIKNKLNKFRKEFNGAQGKRKDAIAIEVAAFLLEWLQNHIKGDDQKYIPYLPKPAPRSIPISAAKPADSAGNKFFNTFIWSERYSVGNRKIDEQHKRLLDIFNGLIQSINSGESEYGLEKTFLQLRGYVKNHFRYEESLMKRSRYPGYKFHKDKHDLISVTLKSYRLRFNTGSTLEKERIALEVAEFFKNWLKSHIKIEDQQYRPYMSD